MHPEFEVVIGLEVHCQLATDSKIFCSSKSRMEEGHSVADEQTNGNTCPVCAGHPGTLPVLNKKAVQYAVSAGLALGCEIRKRSVFSRKNYFYPDLPKGYQITQFDLPICEHGVLEIELENGHKKQVRIERIHMEEDAGKNIHMTGYSLVNLNRASTPLIEIVTRPDMRSPEEASGYLKALHAVVTYLGITDGNMQEGNFRCDANVSVMPKGSQVFGTRTEVKNLNSFKFVEKAIEYEAARQIEVIQSGGKVIQETRGFDATHGKTFSMRSKEEAHDYRYFPEPDLPPLVITDEWIQKLRADLPELPTQKRDRFVSEYGLSKYDAGVLTASRSMATFFEETMSLLETRGKKTKSLAKVVSNYLSGEVFRLINEEGIELHRSQILPEHLADLAPLIDEDIISSTGAKKVIFKIWKSGGSIEEIVEKEGLKQVSDRGPLEAIADDIISKNPQQVEQYRGGKDKLMGFFVGQAMKASQGKANPGLLQEIFKEKLNS
jgi:aspartyl-tRNA(Asn)/glutamyl-tRNA(Gln) amidotransferase subunit B